LTAFLLYLTYNTATTTVNNTSSRSRMTAATDTPAMSTTGRPTVSDDVPEEVAEGLGCDV
jgi:hypothetical protein